MGYMVTGYDGVAGNLERTAAIGPASLNERGWGMGAARRNEGEGPGARTEVFTAFPALTNLRPTQGVLSRDARDTNASHANLPDYRNYRGAPVLEKDRDDQDRQDVDDLDHW